MKIVFHPDYNKSDYADEQAALPGRMEAVMSCLGSFETIVPGQADIKDIELLHTQQHIEKIRSNDTLFRAAMLAAGGAIRASQIAMAGECAFAAIRPPGHHAYKNSSWGYCYFNNLGIALQKLFTEGRISSAFVLDFDAHTGDGTLDCFKGRSEVQIVNVFADDRDKYMQVLDEKIAEAPQADIIAINAGFDSYKLDVGRKLEKFDFYQIGYKMKRLSVKWGHQRRFACLEGGYYLPDLGENVLSFCDGFK
jgi:acetoin utilization deacetylase AcuC-like enzyme